MAFWLWIAAACAAAALIGMALASRIRVRVRYSRSGRLDQLVVIVQALFGLISYQMIVPSIFLRGAALVYNERTKQGAVLPGQDGRENARKRRFSIRTFKRYRRSYRELTGSTRRFGLWLRSSLCKVECSRLRMDVRIGTGDAAETAVIAGLAWTLYGCATGMLSRLVRLKTPPHGEVLPVYGKSEFEIVLEADFRMRVADAIAAIAKLGARTVRLRRAWKAWRSLMHKPGVV